MDLRVVSAFPSWTAGLLLLASAHHVQVAPAQAPGLPPAIGALRPDSGFLEGGADPRGDGAARGW